MKPHIPVICFKCGQSLVSPHHDASLSITEHILRAECHAQMAKEMCYTVDGPLRPRRTRLALDRAQQILIKLHLKELKKHT